MNKPLIYGAAFWTLFSLNTSMPERFDKNLTYASREEGIQYLIEKAERNEPEIGMVYLPDKNTWINTTIKSQDDRAEVDVGYIDSLAKTNDKIELWHLHNDKDIEISKDSPLYWITPSPEDLSQLFYFEGINPEIKAGIATKHGCLMFWTDSDMREYPTRFLPDLIREEASRLQYVFGDSKDLEETAKNYRGIIWTEWRDKK